VTEDAEHPLVVAPQFTIGNIEMTNQITFARDSPVVFLSWGLKPLEKGGHLHHNFESFSVLKESRVINFRRNEARRYGCTSFCGWSKEIPDACEKHSCYPCCRSEFNSTRSHIFYILISLSNYRRETLQLIIAREINSKWKANREASSRSVREEKFIKRETRAIVNLDISFPYRDNGCPFITVAN